MATRKTTKTTARRKTVAMARKSSTARKAPAAKRAKSTVKKSGHWFNDMTATQKRAYIAAHPNSIYAKGGKKPAKPASPPVRTKPGAATAKTRAAKQVVPTKTVSPKAPVKHAIQKVVKAAKTTAKPKAPAKPKTAKPNGPKLQTVKPMTMSKAKISQEAMRLSSPQRVRAAVSGMRSRMARRRARR